MKKNKIVKLTIICACLVTTFFASTNYKKIQNKELALAISYGIGNLSYEQYNKDLNKLIIGKNGYNALKIVSGAIAILLGFQLIKKETKEKN